MIVEGIVTTANADGSVNISPMGPIVDEGFQQLVLRPFQTSRTYANLKRTGKGVFHVTDDVELLAQAAVGEIASPPPLLEVAGVDGAILANACRWYAFRVGELDDREERTRIVADVVATGDLRCFIGFNRAKHAVVEAAILATRIAFLPRADILADFEKLTVLVQKTGGPAEHRAFEFLSNYVRQAPQAASHV